MASDIHKKLVLGALGCGGLLVVLAGIGVLLQQGGLVPATDASQPVTPGQSLRAWDSLSTTSLRGVIALPPVPARPRSSRAPGTLFIGKENPHEFIPPFGDTFPPLSRQRQAWERTAALVSIAERPPLVSGMQMPGISNTAFAQSRVFLAAAEGWMRRGEAAKAELAIDSVLALARSLTQSTELDQVLAGARIERDAMEVLARDTALAGDPATATQAARAVPPLGEAVGRLRDVDRWLLVAGATPSYVDSLAAFVADSAVPLAVRVASVRAIGDGWEFSPTEPGMGISPLRMSALGRLRLLPLPGVLDTAIDGYDLSRMSLTARIRFATEHRLIRSLSDWR